MEIMKFFLWKNIHKPTPKTENMLNALVSRQNTLLIPDIITEKNFCDKIGWLVHYLWPSREHMAQARCTIQYVWEDTTFARLNFSLE